MAEPHIDWNEDQQQFIDWLIEIAVTDWRPENESHFEELVDRVLGYTEALVEINEGERRKVEMVELVQLRDALKEDGEPEAAGGMQVIIDRGIAEYRRAGSLN